MENLEDKLREFKQKVSDRISELLETHGVPSVHNNENVLVIQNEEFNFNLEGRRWLVEISQDSLIDNEGYDYGHDVLDIEHFVKALDHIAETSVNFKVSFLNDSFDEGIDEYFDCEEDARELFNKMKLKKSVFLEKRNSEPDRHGCFKFKTIDEFEFE